MNDTLLEKAIVNVNDILNICINHDQSRRSLVVYDNDFGLTHLHLLLLISQFSLVMLILLISIVRLARR